MVFEQSSVTEGLGGGTQHPFDGVPVYRRGVIDTLGENVGFPASGSGKYECIAVFQFYYLLLLFVVCIHELSRPDRAAGLVSILGSRVRADGDRRS